MVNKFTKVFMCLIAAGIFLPFSISCQEIQPPITIGPIPVDIITPDVTQPLPDSEGSDEAQLNLGKTLFSQQEYRKAAAVYENTMPYLPVDYSGADTGWFTYGVCNSQIQDYQKAIKAFETYLLNYPQGSQYAEATYRLADSYNLAGKVLIAEAQGKKQEQNWQDFLIDSENEGDKKAEVNSEKKRAPAKLPELSLKEKKEKAEQYFNQSYRLFNSFVGFWPDSPFYPNALLSLGLLCQRLGRNNESLRYLALIKDKSPESPAPEMIAFYQAQAYQSLKQHREAIPLFSKIMAGQDKDYAPLSRYHCALSYYLSGDYAVSAGEFSQFVVLYNQDLLVPMATYYSLASLFYESLRKYNNPENPEAFKQLQEILEPTIKQLQGLVSTYPGTEASTLASILASESSDIPFPEEKTVAFSCPVFDLASYAKDALAKYPAGPAKALFDEGEGLMEKQLYQEAGGCFLAIVNNFPDSGLVLSAQYKLGLLYGNLSAFTQGISAFKEVLKIDPKNELAGDCLYLIAYYYMSVNNYGTATKYLEQLIRAFPFSLRTPWAKKDIELMKQELEAKKAKKEAEAMKKKSLLEKEKQIHAIDTKIPIHE